ncbi:hypothetical protein [Prosthecobacter sp.]|uniref:hypothetical protein n=1 Tax=Prosthecobacter sp. TaxID=1965333 RepID=UPI003784B5E8
MNTPLQDFWNEPPGPWFQSISRQQWQVKLEHARAVVDAVCTVLDAGRGVEASEWSLITVGDDGLVHVPEGWGSGSLDTPVQQPLNRLLSTLLSDNDFNSQHGPREWKLFFAGKPRRRDLVIPPIAAPEPEPEQSTDEMEDDPSPVFETMRQPETIAPIEPLPPQPPLPPRLVADPPKPRRKRLLPVWITALLVIVVAAVGIMAPPSQWLRGFSKENIRQASASDTPDLGVIAPPGTQGSASGSSLADLAPPVRIPPPEPGAPIEVLVATWEADAKGRGRLILKRGSRTAFVDFRMVEDPQYQPRGAQQPVKIPGTCLAVRKLSEGLWHFILDGGGGSEQPMNHVSWREAHKLCQTLDAAISPRGRLKARLPWQWEWEKAASTEDGAGLADIFTGKGEWMEDAWQENNRVWPGIGVTDDRGSGMRVIRGGTVKAYVLHTTFKNDADKQLADVGIRLCIDPSP